MRRRASTPPRESAVSAIATRDKRASAQEELHFSFHEQAAMSAACPGRSSTAAPRLWPTEAEVTARWPLGRRSRSASPSPDAGESRPSQARRRPRSGRLLLGDRRSWAGRPPWARATQRHRAGVGRAIVKAVVRRRLAGRACRGMKMPFEGSVRSGPNVWFIRDRGLHWENADG
jgi:hypothetical protein